LVYELTDEQRLLILKMKKSAVHKKYDENNKIRKSKHDISKLAQAFMKYLDLIGVEVYRTKNVGSTLEKKGMKQRMFTPGELGKITNYLKEKELIGKDDWGRYVVKWRKGGR